MIHWHISDVLLPLLIQAFTYKQKNRGHGNFGQQHMNRQKRTLGEICELRILSY